MHGGEQNFLTVFLVHKTIEAGLSMSEINTIWTNSALLPYLTQPPRCPEKMRTDDWNATKNKIKKGKNQQHFWWLNCFEAKFVKCTSRKWSLWIVEVVNNETRGLKNYCMCVWPGYLGRRGLSENLNEIETMRLRRCGARDTGHERECKLLKSTVAILWRGDRMNTHGVYL